MKRIFVIFIYFIANTLFSQNQEATIYFADGTSLDGFGMIDGNKIKFRISLNDKPDSWDSDFVNGIKFYGFEFIADYEYAKINRSDSKPELLRVLTKGNVSLYSTEIITAVMNSSGLGVNISPYYNETTIYYLKKEADPFVKPFKGSFEKYTKEYFKDCPALVRRIEERKFTKDNILELVDFYNDICSD